MRRVCSFVFWLSLGCLSTQGAKITDFYDIETITPPCLLMERYGKAGRRWIMTRMTSGLLSGGDRFPYAGTYDYFE